LNSASLWRALNNPPLKIGMLTFTVSLRQACVTPGRPPC
jgi:hypothetical protein